MSALLDCPAPHLDERLAGYLRRLALRNGYAGWRDMVRAVEFKPTTAVMENHIEALLSALGLSQDKIHSFLVTEMKWQPIRRNFERKRYEPICVPCLQESEHLRREWSHCLVVACPNHGVELIDRCPSCSEMLENTRTGIAFCDCGFDLRFAKPSRSTPIQCWSSARMSGDMRTIETINEIGGAVDYPHLANLLLQLGTRFDPKSKIGPGAVARPKTVQETLSLIEPVLAILEDVRPRLAAHVSARFAEGDQGAFNLSGRLGAWYTALDNVCRKTGAFPIVWEIFSDAVFENFDGLIRGQTGLTPTLGKKRQFLGVSESAKLIGVGKSVLKNAIAERKMPVRVGREGISYAVCMLARADCEAAIRSRREWMSRTEAMDVLGVPSATLQHLIDAGIVRTDETWDRSLFKGGPINASVVHSLCERLAGFVRVRDEPHTMTFNQINARRTVDIKAIVSLFQAVFSGEVCPVGRVDRVGLGGYVFSYTDVKNYLGTAALQSGLTLTQLSTATGWKYESVAGWANQGLLETEVALLQGRQARIVTAPALARFRKEWVPIADLAAAGGSKGSAVTKHLAAGGIEILGQSPQKNGTVRGGLIRLSDLVEMAGLAKRSAKDT